jgi:hypothetical protein
MTIEAVMVWQQIRICHGLQRELDAKTDWLTDWQFQSDSNSDSATRSHANEKNLRAKNQKLPKNGAALFFEVRSPELSFAATMFTQGHQKPQPPQMQSVKVEATDVTHSTLQQHI